VVVTAGKQDLLQLTIALNVPLASSVWVVPVDRSRLTWSRVVVALRVATAQRERAPPSNAEQVRSTPRKEEEPKRIVPAAGLATTARAKVTVRQLAFVRQATSVGQALRLHAEASMVMVIVML